MLENIQTVVNDAALTDEEKDKKMQVISKALVQSGTYTMQFAAYADTAFGAMTTATVASTMTVSTGTMYALTGLTSTFSWATAGIVAVAKSGLDYRKYKKGEMTKD
jgi:hypothetical protein